MTVFPGRTIVLLCLLVFSLPNASCRYNRKYLPLSRRIVENVTLLNFEDKFSVINLQKDLNLEFRNSYFPFLGDQIIRALNYSTKSLILRRGTVKKMEISSPVLEVLQVINTGLVTLEAVPFSNFSLRQLTIRSAQFSRWSPSLSFLNALEEIDISYCNFTYLNMDWFVAYPKLRLLDVANNRLTALEIGPAWNMRALQKLHLWANRLEQLQRFPDAFPRMDGVTLSQNRWRCGWLTRARDAIWSMGVVLMDMDSVCQPGWVNNGGLCCRPSVIWERKFPKRKATAADIDLELQKVADGLEGATVVNGSVVGMRMGKADVFLDKPLPT